MKKIKTILCALLAVILSFTILVGCSTPPTEPQTSTDDGMSEATATPSEDEQVTLRLFTYYDEANAPAHDRAVEILAEKYPNVTIELVQRTGGDDTEVKTMAAVGDLPDIFESWPTIIEALKSSGDIQNLNSAAEEYGFYDDVLVSVGDSIKNANGDVYSVNAYEPYNYLLFYNEDIFTQAGVEVPTNFETFVSASQQLREKDVLPVALFQDLWVVSQLFDALSVQYETSGIRGLDEGTTAITDEAYVKAAEDFLTLVQSGAFSESVIGTPFSQASELFLTGQSAMFLNGSWYLRDVAQSDLNIGFVETPFTKAGTEDEFYGNRSGGPALGGWSVSSKTEYPELAAQVCLDYAKARAQAGTELYGQANMLTSEIEPNEPRAEILSDFSDYVADGETGTIFQYDLSNVALKNALDTNITLLLADSMTAEEFVNAVAESVELAG